MRILYHHRTQAEDAQGVHIHEMINAFRHLGHEVEIEALVQLDEAREEKIRGGRWKWLTRYAPNWFYELMGLAYNLFGYIRLSRRIKSRRPHLIYERYALNTFCGIWASRRFRIPLILEVNSPIYHEQKKLGKLTLRRLARFSERWICSHSTCTFVVSAALKSLLLKEGVPAEKMIVMPNGIDQRNFHPYVSGDAVRRRYGLEGKLVVGFVGWFRKWHGLEMLLEVIRDGRLMEQGVRVLLVGDGPASADLYRYSKRNRLDSVVIFTGPVKRREIAAHIATMDIAVQPGAPEYACPMKIFEYMAMGKCIVAPDQPNIREILEDGVNGYLFRSGDQHDLRSALLKAIEKPAERQAVGQKAYETICERRYLWTANAEKTLQLVFGNAVQQTADTNVLSYVKE